MQYQVLLVLATLTLAENRVLAQPTKPSHKVEETSSKTDSVFTSNFASIKQKLRQKKPLTISESSFIYVAGFMSGIPFNLESYSGIPVLTLPQLAKFEKWYAKNRSRISWNNVAKGLKLISSPLTDSTVVELENLKII